MNGGEPQEADREVVPTVKELQLDGVGPCLLPQEFAAFTGDVTEIRVLDARESPADHLAEIRRGVTVVLTGPYRYVDAVFRYCQHHK